MTENTFAVLEFLAYNHRRWLRSTDIAAGAGVSDGMPSSGVGGILQHLKAMGALERKTRREKHMVGKQDSTRRPEYRNIPYFRATREGGSLYKQEQSKRGAPPLVCSATPAKEAAIRAAAKLRNTEWFTAHELVPHIAPPYNKPTVVGASLRCLSKDGLLDHRMQKNIIHLKDGPRERTRTVLQHMYRVNRRGRQEAAEWERKARRGIPGPLNKPIGNTDPRAEEQRKARHARFYERVKGTTKP